MNRKYLAALQYLNNNDNLTYGDFQRKFPLVADDIIGILKSKKAITLLTDGSIWSLDKNVVDALITYYKGNSSVSYLIKKNWKTCLEVLGLLVTIITTLVMLL